HALALRRGGRAAPAGGGLWQEPGHRRPRDLGQRPALPPRAAQAGSRDQGQEAVTESTSPYPPPIGRETSLGGMPTSSWACRGLAPQAHVFVGMPPGRSSREVDHEITMHRLLVRISGLSTALLAF